MSIDGISFVNVGIAFAGGVVSFVSPCVLPLVPIYLGHLSGEGVQAADAHTNLATFLHAVAFVSGFSVIFILLGATVGLLGGTAGGHQGAIARGAGLLLIVMGLYIAGAFKLPGLRQLLQPLSNSIDWLFYRERRAGYHDGPNPSYLRSLGVGAAFAVGWTPCITPVLGAILTLAYASSGGGLTAWSSAGQAALLLSFYAAGLSLPFLISGAAVSRITPTLKRFNRLLPAISMASGLLLIVVGILVFENIVTKLNRYFGFLPYIKL